MKRLILLVVLLCGTALWPISQVPAPSVAFQSTAGLFHAPDGLVHRRVNGVDVGPVDGSFGPAYGLIPFSPGGTLLYAQEIVTLTTPVVPPSNTACRLERLTLEPIAGRIYVQLLGTNGEASSKVYDATTTPTGASLLSSLNTSNNSAGTSLIKRVYTRLIADGVCVGTVSGTPQD